MSPRRSLGALVLVALAASGCAAGQHSETDKERTTPYVAQASIGHVAVRAVRLVVADSAGTASTGPQAYLLASIVNRGAQTDALTGVSIEGGGSVQPTGGSVSSIALPPQQVIQIGDPDLGFTGTALGVSGLTATLVPGTTANVTFTFQDAGTVSVDTPIMSSSDVGTTASAVPINPTG